jgi:AbrB family looped-hinge helix DNA binding protein
VKREGSMAEVSKVGKRGAVVIPAALRRRFGIEEGSLVIAEAREEGVLIRPAVALPTDEYRRQFLAELDREFAALREDPEAWEEELAERRLLDGTLLDGLDPDELWTEDGNVVSDKRQDA